MARASASAVSAGRTVVRCAIYTRKSTDEGLEQEFNSLDAQREACAAYVLSQRHEGWQLVANSYDDGGFSGGSMERPGLQLLLRDIEAGKVDVIVVYKVDRLTRSLADFAKIVEILDARSASFVSVTQAFNTTTSMGRLTLNVLLSFAQFEREVTGERIRDKVAASKAKGIWMGGVVPLGYEVHARKLIVNETDAGIVRMMFERYLALGSVVALKAELDANGICSRVRIGRSGKSYGGVPFTMGALSCILQNPIYLGFICHKGKRHLGEHQAILDQTLFDQVQQRLERNRVARKLGENANQPSLLAGMLWDAHGRRMSPSHAVKASKRYRYYVSRREGAAGNEDIWRVPAGDLEEVVLGRLVQHLHWCATSGQISAASTAEELRTNQKQSNASAAVLSDPCPSQQRAEFMYHVERVIVARDRITITLKQHVGKCIDISASLVRAGKQVKLVLDGAEAVQPVVRDPALIKLVAKAHQLRARIGTSEAASLDDAAQALGLTRNYLARLVRLSYLAPDIVSSIIEGRQPVTLTRQRLARMGDVPIAWSEQRQLLGF